MLAGYGDLLQIILHLLRMIHVGSCQCREPYNGIHRRADIMGHVVQESRLGPVRVLRCDQRVRKRLLFFLLCPDDLCYVTVITAQMVRMFIQGL